MAQHNIGHFEKVRALTCGARVLVVGGAREGAATQVTFFDVVSHKRVTAAAVPAHVLGLALAGDVAAAACADGKLRLFKAGTGEALREIEAHAGPVTGVAALSEGGKLVTSGVDGKLRMFSAASGEKLGEWALSPLPLRAAAIDPTGAYVAGAGDDGVVRSVTVASGEVREMPGHEGPVLSLAFTPRDGRLVSGGDDGMIRIWFLAGDVESELRGKEDGHKGSVHSLLFLPQPKQKAGADDPGDRLVSAGSDGKVKIWRLGDRRKPKTLDVQGDKAAHALAFARVTKGEQFGLLLVGGDNRSVDAVSVDTAGTPGEAHALGHGFGALLEALSSGGRPAREAAVRELAALEEQEALEPVLRALNDRFPEVQELAAKELGKHRRSKARAALRGSLNSAHEAVRVAAYEALAAIEGAVGAARAALESKVGSMRSSALLKLASWSSDHEKDGPSPLVLSLISGRLTDSERLVRCCALHAYGLLSKADAVEPVLVAFERGPADLRAEALIKAALEHKLTHAKVEAILAKALDDEDSSVRRASFVLQVLQRPSLAARLLARDADFSRAYREVQAHAAALISGIDARLQNKAPDDMQQQAAQARLVTPGDAEAKLDEGSLVPLLAAMACRSSDIALRGARGLAELGDTRALGALLQLSREGDKQIRREAAVALRALEDPRAKRRLVWMLDDADADVRTAAYDAYGKLEADPLELAEAALRSSQKDIRVQGLNLLVKQGEKRSGTAETLLGDALEDESSDVRAEAFKTLWAWHTKEPAQALDRALSARFSDLRLRAVSELETLAKTEGWARARLLSGVSDRDEGVALAAFEALLKLDKDTDKAAEAPLAAMGSVHGAVRARGAKASSKLPVDAVRGPLMKQLNDEHAAARAEALSALDALLPREAGPLYAGLQSSFYDLKVQAAELLAARHDEQIIDAMRGFLGDKELPKKIPQELAPALHSLRQRAATALASLGSGRLIKYFSSELLKDADGGVREQAARGLSLACRKGDESNLLDALGHGDVAVRSWAAEGLAKLGDARALPVLTGHLRHEHPPVRVGSIVSFAALGPEGYGGMLQGLEDSAREVQELVFMIVLSRDLRAFRKGEAPELLTSALSSQRAEIRYAAGRALELRGDPERYLHHLIEVLLPPKPEKASGMKDWPDEHERARRMVGLAQAIASDLPEVRYAATQALRLRHKPLEYFKQAEQIARLHPASQPPVADTAPRASKAEEPWGASGWLRRLFRESGAGPANDEVPDTEQHRLRWLAFGAYVGLLRQAVAGDDEGVKVRRDVIERVVELAQKGHVSATAALPPLGRALDDPNYLVRKAAFAGLRKLFAEGADEPLVMALASHHDDVARAALEELGARGEGGRKAVARALNSPLAEVREFAFELLEGLFPKGSLEPLFAALESDFADMRLGVLRRLAHSRDERVLDALLRALRSDHDDLRLQAAELLAGRKNDACADPLGAFLRSDDDDSSERAREALVLLGSAAAVEVLAARLGDDVDESARSELLEALGRTRHEAALAPICQRFADESEDVRGSAFDAVIELCRVDSARFNLPRLVSAMRSASQARDPQLRVRAAGQLHDGEESGQSAVLQSMFLDREAEVRVAAVEGYSHRVRRHKAPVAPLEDVLRRGARETMLAAAEGVAEREGKAALRPLLLFTRAGEGEERPRAILALGALGDARALDELEVIASGGTEEAPVESSMRAAAYEALGRMHNRLSDADAKKRIVDRLEPGVNDADEELQRASLRGLRWLGGERGRVKIESCLLDANTDWRTRQQAAELLGELKDSASEQALVKGLEDSDSDVRNAVYKALRRLFPDDRSRVEFYVLTRDEGDLREKAAAFLASNGDASMLLAKLEEIDDAALSRRLFIGLLRRPSIAAAQLAAQLGHKNAVVRSNAAWLIGARSAEGKVEAGDAATFEKALLAAEGLAAAGWAARPDDEAQVRAWHNALWTLRLLASKGVAARQIALASGGAKAAPPRIRKVAVLALASSSGAEVIAALKAALGDPDASVRGAAAASLRKIDGERALDTALAVKPFDPVSFGATASKATAANTATEAGRRLLLPTILRERQGALALPRLAAAKGQELLELIAMAGSAGGPEVFEALKSIAFDKKKYEVAERKAAYRALRRAQRKAEKSKQEVRA